MGRQIAFTAEDGGWEHNSPSADLSHTPGASLSLARQTEVEQGPCRGQVT